MGDGTKIAWTEATWNPVTGCTKVSAGCKHCYAEREWPRLAGNRRSIYCGRDFTDVRGHPERLDQPIRWRKPRRIFVNSMSDMFHEDIPDEFIIEVFNVMRQCRRHVFQILTKRPERMLHFASRLRFYSRGNGRLYLGSVEPDGVGVKIIPQMPWICFGVSVEDQSTADERIPLLLQTPVAVRFVSYEPALGAVDFSRWMPCPRGGPDHCPNVPETCCQCDIRRDNDASIDWLIVGGESGPKARACNVQWIRDTVRQCREAMVACFVKQLGANVLSASTARADAGKLLRRHLDHRAGADPSEWPADLRVQEYPVGRDYERD